MTIFVVLATVDGHVLRKRQYNGVYPPGQGTGDTLQFGSGAWNSDIFNQGQGQYYPGMGVGGFPNGATGGTVYSGAGTFGTGTYLNNLFVENIFVDNLNHIF